MHVKVDTETGRIKGASAVLAERGVGVFLPIRDGGVVYISNDAGFTTYYPKESLGSLLNSTKQRKPLYEGDIITITL